MFGQFKNYLKHKHYVLPVLLLYSPCLCGTTTVVILTPDAVISGADRLGTGIGILPTSTVTKVVSLRGRFVVTCIGVEQANFYKVVLYSFPHWVRGVESQIGHNTSIFQLVGIIEKESSRTFTDTVPVEKMMKSGAIKPSKALNKYFAQFLVAGFNNRIPTLVNIYYELDWKGKRLIGPTRKIEFPTDHAKGAVFTAGKNDAIEHFNNPDTDAYKRLKVLLPATFNKPILTFTRNESIQLVRALIGIETELEPSSVGRGSTIIGLTLDGKTWIKQYDASQVLPNTGHYRKHN